MNLYKEFPKSIIIEPTVNCNRSCYYCPRVHLNGKDGYMKMELFRKLMNEISKFSGRTVYLFRRGESLLHPEIINMFRYARPRVEDIQLTTNATLLTPEMSDELINLLDFISFSIDIPEKYTSNRGGDYNTVLRNVEYFLSKANGVSVQVSMVRTNEHTEEDIEQFMNFWKGRVERVRVYDLHSADGKYGSLSYNRGKRQTCMKPFSEILIYWDGSTGRCNHDWDGERLGDVNKQTIQEVWYSEPYRQLRQQHETLELTDNTCKTCNSWYPTFKEQGTGLVIKE